MDEPKFKALRRHERADHARLLNFSCYQNRDFLRSSRCCDWMIEAMEKSREMHRFRLWAYCIMPNHVHLLIWPRTAVPPILRSLKQSVALRALNWTRANAPEFLPQMLDEQPNGKRSHRFWQRGGGYDRNLWEPEAIWNAIDYIHLNPVKAGLCESPCDWEWSSAGKIGPEKKGPLEIDFETIPGRPA